MIIEQTLLIIGNMMINGCCTANWPRNIYTARISAYKDILPRINGNTVDTITMQHTTRRTIGIKQHRTRSATITTHLIDALTINTYQYGLVIVWTDAADGVLDHIQYYMEASDDFAHRKGHLEHRTEADYSSAQYC